MKSARSRRSDERGVVLVWLAITLVLLLAVLAVPAVRTFSLRG